MFTTWLWFVCYRLVYTVHCACLWAWLGSYCSGPVIRKHLSSHIMLLFRVALRFLYPLHLYTLHTVLFRKQSNVFPYSLKVYLVLFVEVDAVTAVGNSFSAAVLYCTRQRSAESNLFLASTAKTTTPLLKTLPKSIIWSATNIHSSAPTDAERAHLKDGS